MIDSTLRLSSEICRATYGAKEETLRQPVERPGIKRGSTLSCSLEDSVTLLAEKEGQSHAIEGLCAVLTAHLTRLFFHR